MKNQMAEEDKQEKEFQKTVRRKTLSSFAWFFLFIILCISGWMWLNNQPKEAGALKPLRKVLSANEKVFSSVFSTSKLEPEYPKSSAAVRVRVNGFYGVKGPVDTAEWKLRVVRNADIIPAADTLVITLDEIKKLPKTEVVFDFKCIEGWSQVTWWGGVRFSDFAEHFHLGTKSGSLERMKKEDVFGYAGLETPDKEYYVGIDMPSMMQPQTILCYEMNGKPLPMNQGAPLRLIIPVKYGVKHIKRIGTIFFSDSPPPDFWYIRGYDYYAGL
jgi:hypothetical protein